MDIILCCCILHNVAIKWDSNKCPQDQGEHVDNEEIVLVDDNLDNEFIRAQGALVRDNLRLEMPPPSASERRRMNM